MDKTLVVVPTYNEADGINELLKLAREALPSAHFLVVDDSSPDGTGEIITKIAERDDRVQLLSRSSKEGLGRAYVAGFKEGLQQGFTRFIEMDADLSHDPADLPRLVAATETADVAIGSRYVKGGAVSGWSRGRHLLSMSANAYAFLLLGIGVVDSTSGFRCYRRKVLEALELETISSEGYAFQVEMVFRARREGFEITEIPIVFRERSQGKSKMSKQIVLEGMLWVTRTGLRRLTSGTTERRP
ncbi:MAG: polyprenol monophosphomannose synthase [Actinobacteria bacterium]|nr:polyprenol monophosphomannose synthase [Actinomycetota bacterium]